MEYNTIVSGKRIQELRKKNGMTQASLAEVLNIHAASLCAIEKGRRPASIDLLLDLAELFDVSLDYLVLGKCLPGDPLLFDEVSAALSHLEEVARILNLDVSKEHSK